ncbi:MAG TPA: type II secretion system protein [Verrucomicrobiae bacterium]|nr:type II secretion system protein [Verrucomicrobiae bacterium]
MKATLAGRRRKENAGPDGFTLIELLAVMAMMVLLALTLLPARADSRTHAQGVRCQDNLRQVMGAVQAYTHDFQDRFPPNPDDGNTLPGHNWCPGNAATGGPAQFNPDILTDPTRCLIASYLDGQADVFRCTADLRRGLYQGSNPALVGKIVPAARTISMNVAVGSVCSAYYGTCSGHSGATVFPSNGAWLTGTRNCAQAAFRTYGRTSQVLIPGPANLMVITEEDPWSINDGVLSAVANPQEPVWIDYPSTLHNLGCVMVFADGHTELHKWGPAMPKLGPNTGPGQRVANGSNLNDFLWLAARLSAPTF